MVDGDLAPAVEHREVGDDEGFLAKNIELLIELDFEIVAGGLQARINARRRTRAEHVLRRDDTVERL